MCIVFFLKTSSNSLLIASNRDELIERDSASADWWSNLIREEENLENEDYILQSKSRIIQYVFGGFDRKSIESIGSWLGINKASGRFAFVTNVQSNESDPLVDGKISRGVLVADYLGLSAEDEGGEEYLQRHVCTRKDDFNGFNLIIGGLDKNDDALHYFGNRSGFKTPVQLQKDTCFAITNTESLYLEPNHPSQWPKSRKGLEEFDRIVKKYDINSLDQKNKKDLIHDLVSLLQNSSCEVTEIDNPIYLARQTINVAPLQMPTFPEGKLCGTVTHTVIHVDSQGNCTFVEIDALKRKETIWKEFTLFL